LPGTPSAREACAQFAFINGLRPNASPAADGRGVRIGTLADLERKTGVGNVFLEEIKKCTQEGSDAGSRRKTNETMHP